MKVINENELTEDLFETVVIDEFFRSMNMHYVSKGDESSSTGRVISSTGDNVYSIKFIFKNIGNERLYQILLRNKNSVEKWKGIQLSELVDDIEDVIKNYLNIL